MALRNETGVHASFAFSPSERVINSRGQDNSLSLSRCSEQIHPLESRVNWQKKRRHIRSSSLSAPPVSPLTMSIPIHAPKPQRLGSKPETTRRSSIDGARPPSRSERLLRDALQRDTTARKPSSDQSNHHHHHHHNTGRIHPSSPQPTSRKMSSANVASIGGKSPTSPNHIVQQQQLPLTPQELQLRARLQGSLKRSETENHLYLPSFENAYEPVPSKPYPSPPSSTTTISDEAHGDTHIPVTPTRSHTQRTRRRFSRTHVRSTSVPPILPQDLSPRSNSFTLPLPMASPLQQDRHHPHIPMTPPVEFDPVSAAAHCSKMSGYVSFASVIPPPVGDDEEEDTTCAKPAGNSSTFWNWWNR